MPTRDPEERGRGRSDEVNLGFTEHLALLEAQRCLACKRATCVEGCPVSVDIPTFVRQVEERDLAAAAHTLFGDNTLPAITGRVCPQEHAVRGGVRSRAQGRARRHRSSRTVRRRLGAGHLTDEPTVIEPSGKRIAIIGAGPGGLTAAGELARCGHDVTIYEALHLPGGVLSTASPSSACPTTSCSTRWAASRHSACTSNAMW